MNWLLAVFGLLIATVAQAQNCGTDALHTQQFGRNLQYARQQQLANQQTYERVRQLAQPNGPVANRLEATQFTLPVVVHVMHKVGTAVGTGENISDAQISQGIAHLNEAFRAAAPYNGPGAADTEIQFCLAKIDPNGLPTTGIIRLGVADTLTDVLNSVNDLTLKNQSRWPTNRYINIWLVKEITMSGFGPSVAGYAYLAGAHGLPFDGIVNEARWFGSSVNNSKIHIHEMGHYLNLYHTFEGGCPNANCLTNGDRVCDTPPDNSTAAVSCAGTANTCTTDPADNTAQNPFRPVIAGGLGDQNDLINNYMDYGYQSCQNAFTDGQKQRMLALLVPGGLRRSLVNPADPASCQVPCTTVITPNFTISPGLTINVGSTVSFNNLSSGATTFEWRENGTVFDLGTTPPPRNYATPGTYLIRLVARNANPVCEQFIEYPLEVRCPSITAGFNLSTSPTVVAGTTITFTNTSSGASTYQWLQNGVPFSSVPSPSLAFNTQGTYRILLRAGDGACTQDFFRDITVTCPVTASFTASATTVFVGTTVNFANTSTGHTGVTWRVGGAPVGTGNTYSQAFGPPANDYLVELIATNGICNDTARQVVRVFEPGSCGSPGARVWAFGTQSGVNFNLGSPPPQALSTALDAPEGCASVTDRNGNLLFYTDGRTVYNASHVAMTNGTGLLGNPNAVQSAQIVPVPGSNNLFHLFTLGADGGILTRSLVDMAANAVVASVKNLPVVPNAMTEKQVATMHADGCNKWLLTHTWGGDQRANDFYAFLLDASGNVTGPVISSGVGSPIFYPVSPQSPAPFDGQMKISPQGDKVAFATIISSTAAGGDLGIVEVFDFDNLTGRVSNPRRIYERREELPYGIEFSPNGQLLYFTTNEAAGTIGGGGDSRLYQHQLASNVTASIYTTNDFGLWGLQLGPDGLVYAALLQSSFLGRVNAPNALGVGANFVPTAVNLLPPGGQRNRSQRGLPAPVPAPFFDFDFSFDCEAQLTRFRLNRYGNQI
ncbi:MAG: M43 family zinc metalloprotease, partial [Bernardetiaceae bacterium]|nr:M43 family zinc metalloprotease [Bernardetiaceae bacterium]